MKLYTRAGDDGMTALIGGRVIHKSDLRLEVCGTFDEANSLLGLARSYQLDSWSDGVVLTVQRDLFSLGAELACCGKPMPEHQMLQAVDVKRLEAAIDEAEDLLEPLDGFVVPGGSLAASTVHVARATMRRAERRIVELSLVEGVRRELIAYTNRVSDLLFVLARRTNWLTGGEEMRVRANKHDGMLPSTPSRGMLLPL